MCHQLAVAPFGSMVQICFYVQLSVSLLDVVDPKHKKPEEISVPCQPTASADGTDAFSLLPVDSLSLIFQTKLPTAGLLILFYLSFWHLLLRPIKFDMCVF